MEELRLIGQTIKDKRLSLNLRMDDVADKAGITRATLWSIESGNGNYSIKSLLKVMDILNMPLNITFSKKPDRDRATRSNSLLDKKINRFVVMCVEQYALAIRENSRDTYSKMKEKGIIDDLVNDYEDLHGMSHIYLNDYIHALMEA